MTTAPRNDLRRFEAICKQLEKYEFVPPKKPLEPSIGTPKCSVLMLPSVDECGTLETLVGAAARYANNNVAESVDNFLAIVGSDKWKSEVRVSKAWLRSTLAATCSDPFVPLGEVFTRNKHKKLIPLEHKSLDGIAKFLSSLS